MKLPAKLTEQRKSLFIVLFRAKKGLTLGEVALKLFEDDTAKARSESSSMLNQFKNSGFVVKTGDKWGLTDDGKILYENLDSIPTIHKTAKKKEGKPAPRPLDLRPEPSLSVTATSAANMLGAVIDENNQYRTFLKQHLETVAKFIGAEINYPDEEQ